MIRRLVEGLVGLVVLAVAGSMTAGYLLPQPGTGFWWRASAIMAMPQDSGTLDVPSIVYRATPNEALSCPEAKCFKAKPAIAAPIFPIPAAELRKLLDIVVEAEPRSARLDCTSDCDRHARYVQYSALFGFPDTIDVEVIEAGANASTLAIYSRSVFGYWDFGVNRERIERWLHTLEQIVPRS